MRNDSPLVRRIVASAPAISLLNALARSDMNVP
jgi:hypothetical protein